MGFLDTRSSKQGAQSNQSASPRGRLAPASGLYNHSSLALDLQEDGAALAWERPMPQLVPHRAPLRTAALGSMFVGLDVATGVKDSKSKTISFIVHAGIIVGVLWWGVAQHQIIKSQDNVTPIKFTLTDPPPPVMSVAKVLGGGGGGGEQKLTPPIKAELPRPAPHVQLLPAQIAKIAQPKLAVEPTAQVNMQVASNLPNLGMPDSPQIELASQGSGSHSGFGVGMGGGIGAGHGGGNGIGSGGGYGGGVMNVGGGVSAPEVIHSVEPEFTDEARRANLQGTASIQLIVDSQGNPQNVRVLRHLGMGLDQKAIDAVRQYKFRPAIYQGHPVAVQLVIEVDFRIH